MSTVKDTRFSDDMKAFEHLFTQFTRERVTQGRTMKTRCYNSIDNEIALILRNITGDSLSVFMDKFYFQSPKVEAISHECSRLKIEFHGDSDLRRKGEITEKLRFLSELSRILIIQHDILPGTYIEELLISKKYAYLTNKAIRCVYKQPICGHCQKKPYLPQNPFKQCMQCRLVYYCSRRCQKKSWKSHHRYTCIDFRTIQTYLDV